MKTPEEIKKSLEPCKSANTEDCSYCNLCTECENDQEVLAYIQQLESNDSQVKKALSDIGFASLEAFLQAYNQVKAERDAAVMDLKMYTGCIVCKYEAVAGLDDCSGCGYENEMFEWRGVCEDNSGKDANVHG